MIYDTVQWIRERLWTLKKTFGKLAYDAQDIPLIGNWCFAGFLEISNAFLSAWLDFGYLRNTLDEWEGKIAGILSWDSIRDKITGTWSWVSDPVNRLWDGYRDKIAGTWSFLNTIDDRIWSTAYSRITGTWSWINTIDDRVRSTARGSWSFLDSIDDRIWNTAGSRIRATWSWIDNVDDRIRDVAWSHIAPRLGDWILSWIMLNLTIWAKIGYKVLDRVWNMEWDDDNKEVR